MAIKHNMETQHFKQGEIHAVQCVHSLIPAQNQKKNGWLTV